MTARDRSCISSPMKWFELWNAAAVSFTCSTASMWLFTSPSSRACLFSRWLTLARSFPWSSDCNCSSTSSIQTSSSSSVRLNSWACKNNTRILILCDNCHLSLPTKHVESSLPTKHVEAVPWQGCITMMNKPMWSVTQQLSDKRMILYKMLLLLVTYNLIHILSQHSRHSVIQVHYPRYRTSNEMLILRQVQS